MKEEKIKNKNEKNNHNNTEEEIKVEEKQNEIKLDMDEIQEINKKLKEAEEKALRAQAELVNYRKRKDEDTSKMLKYANEGIITDILLVVDNFERALSVNSEDESLKQGINMIYNNLISILNNYGVKEIKSLNEQFDPSFHQAVAKETDKKKDDNIVLEVFQKGYMLKDKVIRPAMVKVNKIERNDK